MYIFTFVIGFALGFSLKLGADFYVKWVKENEQLTARMEDILAVIKATEMLDNKTHKVDN